MGYFEELIKTFSKNNYGTSVNLHIHTKYSDGLGDANDLVQQAKDKGYEYISITDHNTFGAYHNSNILNEKIVIPGIEFDCWHHGVFFHLLAYGIDINHEALKPFLAKCKAETEVNIIRLFSKRNIKKLISAIHEAGGIAVLAHPACYWCLNLDKFVKSLMNLGLDGIEAYYVYHRLRKIIKFHFSDTAEKIGNKYGLIKTGGTDCHKVILD